MSFGKTKHSLNIYIKNGTSGGGQVLLYHKNVFGLTHASFNIGAGQTSGPMEIHFNTGIRAYNEMDYWGAVLIVTEGSDAGVYTSGGSFLGSGLAGALNSALGTAIGAALGGFAGGEMGAQIGSNLSWKECQLQGDDVDHPPVLSIDTKRFNINLKSGGCSTDVKKSTLINPKIQHIFVLMLENHSFDNIFAMSGIPGVVGATTENYNTYKDEKYFVEKGAPDQMPTDPGHEFLDVLEQLTNQKAEHYDKNPTILNNGFAANYATSTSEDTGTPQSDQIGDVMKCFDTPNQLPVIYQLATEFAICDHWFSSLPGPTWPNRFFVHGASSSGLDDSPSTGQMAEWESANGFKFDNGSIFERLGGNIVAGHPNWSIYQEQKGAIAGRIPQVSAIEGIHVTEVSDFSDFAQDLKGKYTSKYTFIEPNYGDVLNNTYEGGSSQHPMDGVHGGEALIKATYEAIRNSPLWEKSLLIITYDEHGGFYDHVAPPKTIPPGDSMRYNVNGFKFTQLGLRVPAVVVSPYIKKGTVSHTQFEHSSVPATIERAFGLAPMTERDKHANDVIGLLTLDNPRKDCVTSLNNPATAVAVETMAARSLEMRAMPPAASSRLYAQQPGEHLNEAGNNIGFLQILLKSALDGIDDEEQRQALIASFEQITTREEAANFMRQVMVKLGKATPAEV